MDIASAPDHQPALIRLFLAASDIYGIIIIGYMLIWLATGFRLWQITVMAYVLHWLLLPGFVLLPLMLWKKRRIRAALAGAIILVFVILYGELFLPSFSPPIRCAATNTECSSPVVVMSFNLAAGQSDDDRMIEALRASGADIIGLEEFGRADAQQIKEHLSDQYPYQIQQGDLIPGIGLISRYPITEVEFLKPPSQVFLLAKAVIDIDGQAITVIVAHPPPPGLRVDDGSVESRTIVDVPFLIDLIDAGGTALLLADLNVVDQSQEHILLQQAGLVDSWREAGWGFGLTFPAAQYKFLPPLPLWRIDYIWHTSHFAAQRAWIGPSTGSDHLPVLAELILKK
jgi:endonuclease/exonuclease/phosphatase (EEP) superfamily protein YafD